MIEGSSPFVQTILGTGLTWSLTALGAIGCIFIHPDQSPDVSNSIISCCLSFSAGVMVAASFWSLLVPSLDLSTEIMKPHLGDRLYFLPSVFGFILGALFVYLVELYIPNDLELLTINEKKKSRDIEKDVNPSISCVPEKSSAYRRKNNKTPETKIEKSTQMKITRSSHQKRLLMLIFAVTLHNFPEGAAVGIAFSNSNKTHQQFSSAQHLSVGIAVQNFPEGLVVSLPLRAAGFSIGKSIWYGQLSGMVEPLAGIIALYACQIFSLLQPIGLAFAAGTMIYVVFQDVVPEAHEINQKTQAPTSLFAILGFCVMMILEVGLI